MEKDKVQINITDKAKEIIIREGDAPKPIDPVSVTIDGSISAPAEFYLKRKHVLNKDACHVKFSRHKRSISIRVDENLPIFTSVLGSLKENTALKSFKINGTGDFTVLDLQKHIKMNKRYFSSQEDWMKLAAYLSNFKAKIETEIEKSNDLRGAKKDLYATKRIDDDYISFDLIMPIFIGSDPVKFRVELMYDVRESNVSVWLESVELAEIMENYVDKVIDAEIKKFNNEIVIIED